jgi:hypothetical protein
MRKFKIYLFTLVALSFALVYCKKNDVKEAPVKDQIGTVLKTTAVNPQPPAASGPDNQCSNQGGSARTLTSITFGAVPSSSFWDFNLAVASGLDIFLQDCCIRDDVVEVYIDGCLVGVVDSRGGADGTHAGETIHVNLPAGDHTLEYRNTVSLVGASGWYVSETLSALTQVVIDGCATGVVDKSLCDGTSMNDAIAACAAAAGNHGDFVSCVAALTNAWKAAGLITGAQKGAIMSCAAHAN